MCIYNCDIFFFMQKTAYEMRISDWSSDVCSSDLPVTLSPLQTQALATFQFVRAVRIMPSLRIGGRAMRTSNVVTPALPTELALDQSLRVGVFDGGLGHSDLEIGRASCRERVCQYV